mgnify:CR=1 FL=1
MLRYILEASFRKIKLHALVLAIVSLIVLLSIGSSAILPYFFIHVFSLGIAHGALDRWMFNIANPDAQIKKSAFYGSYLIVNACIAILWLVSESLALIFFIIYSAWHFGEVEWAHIFSKRSWLIKVYTTVWGLFLFGSMFLLNAEETIMVVNRTSALDVSIPEITSGYYYSITVSWIFISSLPVLLKWTDKKNFLIQIVNVACLSLIFHVFDLAVSFAVFFFYFHSLPSLAFELKAIDNKVVQPINYKELIQEVLILSAAPVVGAVIFIFLFEKNFIEIGLPLLVVIGSAISFPHTVIYTRVVNKA